MSVFVFVSNFISEIYFHNNYYLKKFWNTHLTSYTFPLLLFSQSVQDFVYNCQRTEMLNLGVVNKRF
jgi:hypothetical protein